MGDKESVREGWRDIDIGQEIAIDRGGGYIGGARCIFIRIKREIGR